MKRVFFFTLLLAVLVATPFDVLAQGSARSSKKRAAKTEQIQKKKPSQGNTTKKQSSSTSGNKNQQRQSETFTVNGVSFTMVWVDGGTFKMGATSEQGSDADDDENPVHQVTLSGYYIGKYEVTQELWLAVMGSNPSHFAPKQSNFSSCSYDNFVADAKRLNAKKAGTVKIPSRAEWDAVMVVQDGTLKLPVEEVSWDDCQTFIRKLNQLTGRKFRLPTEAEWEYAARGGSRSRGYKYSGSDNLDNVAWFDGNSGDKTHPVGTKYPNELGLYDMSGNVFEWCQDWYGEYSSGSKTNPTGPSSGSHCVYRGGSWFYSDWRCRVSFRDGGDYGMPSNSFDKVGLRLAL